VDVGLWDVADGGYVAVDYLALNPTAEKVRERRQKADAERKAKLRVRTESALHVKTRESAGSHGGTDVQTPRSPTASKEARGVRSRDAPDWRELPAYGQLDPQQAAINARHAAEARAAIKRRAS
jgi:hypothetical protein